MIWKACVLIYKIDVAHRRRLCVWRHDGLYCCCCVLYFVLCVCVCAYCYFRAVPYYHYYMAIIFIAFYSHFEHTKLIKFVHRRIEDASIDLPLSVSVCRVGFSCRFVCIYIYIYSVCRKKHWGYRSRMRSMHVIPKWMCSFTFCVWAAFTYIYILCVRFASYNFTINHAYYWVGSVSS